MMRETGLAVQYKNRQGLQPNLNSTFGAKLQFRIADSNQSHPGASAWHCVGLLSYQSRGERQWENKRVWEKDARDSVMRGEHRHGRIEERRGNGRVRVGDKISHVKQISGGVSSTETWVEGWRFGLECTSSDLSSEQNEYQGKMRSHLSSIVK